jgi:hypothetical protein
MLDGAQSTIIFDYIMLFEGIFKMQCYIMVLRWRSMWNTANVFSGITRREHLPFKIWVYM